ncbi:unnamed protein product [Auanema sp. JU1783]|nr:unnamed protein product [Auanema sp. JU1783]
MRHNKFSVILMFLSVCSTSCSVLQQSVGVRGRLLCGTTPINNATVQIMEQPFFRSEKLIAATFTDRQGYFDLSGSSNGVLNVNVNFNVIHDCDDEIRPCYRKVTLGIPPSAVTRSPVVEKYFEAGSMNMAFRYPIERRVC